MLNVYIAAYKDFGDYALLKKVCDYFLSRQDKDNIKFIVTTGESGDNTCKKYVVDNGYQWMDWIPIKQGMNRAEEKLKYLKESDHCILVHDAYSQGIGIALKYAINNVKGKIVVIYPLVGDIVVFYDGKKIIDRKINDLI